jgi:hypothetical protein
LTDDFLRGGPGGNRTDLSRLGLDREHGRNRGRRPGKQAPSEAALRRGEKLWGPPPAPRQADFDTWDDLRFRYDVERLHARGPDALFEMLAELAAERMIRGIVEAKVAQYSSRDRFLASPLLEMPG